MGEIDDGLSNLRDSWGYEGLTTVPRLGQTIHQCRLLFVLVTYYCNATFKLQEIAFG